MASNFEFAAELRTESGTRVARNLRRSGLVPAVLYGGSEEPVMLTLKHHQVVKNLENDAVYSHILDVQYDGKVVKGLLRAIQRHPSKPQIMHMDFLRINQNEAVRVHVPLHFAGEAVCAGVKAGGVVTHHLVDIELSCLPGQLPEFIEVDLSGLAVGESIHLSDLTLADGLEMVALTQGEDHDAVIVSVQAGRVNTDEDDDDAEDGAADSADA